MVPAAGVAVGQAEWVLGRGYINDVDVCEGVAEFARRPQIRPAHLFELDPLLIPPVWKVFGNDDVALSLVFFG